MKAVIFASAQIKDYSFCTDYLKDRPIIICCDGGMYHAKALDIQPDYVVGDFDSVSKELLLEFRAKNIPFRQFPEKKDETDMELGVLLALELGVTELVILGGIGSRMDHTLANCHLLHFLYQKNINALLADENNCIRITDSHIRLKGKKGDLVSLIPVCSEVKGITLYGLEYPLIDATLPFESPRGVSNVMLCETAEVYVNKGCVYVIQSRD